MDQDELFVQGLRARVDAAVPRVDVDVDRVVPRARRRRRVVRGAAGATTLALVLGATWGASAVLGVGPVRDAPPAGLGTGLGADPAVTAAPTPDAEPRPTVPADAVVADDGTVTGVPGDPWDGPDRYWYTLTESQWPQDMDGVVTMGDVERRESWHSRERPGLDVTDGDPTTVSASGPRVVMGSWVVAGVRHDMLADPRVLPTDGGELALWVRAGLEPDRGAGSDDDKVFDVARTMLAGGGLYARELREAFWGVARSLPGAQESTGEDGAGREGVVLTWTGSDGQVNRLVRDPETGLLLEQAVPSDGSYTRYLEQRTRDDVPVEPTLEIAGCTRWATC
ncbi:hypothetical protein [Cellulomonas iranensis]|uniref:hypothetical protein n=1 Tax=Cellulomonas iranensis TaxID=76862 RepID=UPI000B3D26ED|nr:hypothetical protein [Cellulomonas iranensis]